MRVVVSSSLVVSPAPSSSLSSPAPVWGLSNGRQPSTNFSIVGLFHGLQFFTTCSSMGPFHMSFPWAAVLHEQASPAWIPHGVTSPASKPVPVWAPLSIGPQVLPGAFSSTAFPQGHSLLQASTCSGMGSSMGCRCISAPLWTSMSLPHHGLHHGL